MTSKKLAIVGGLLVLLLVLVSIAAGCGSAGNKANPLEDIGSGDKTPEVNPGGNITEFRTGDEGEDTGPSLSIAGPGGVETFSPSDIPGYPEGPPVADGLVRKVTATTLDLESPTGGGPVGMTREGYVPGTETKITQIIFSRDTKVYKELIRTGAKPPIELKEMSINDISEGQQIRVWGEESGSNRILATVIMLAPGN